MGRGAEADAQEAHTMTEDEAYLASPEGKAAMAALAQAMVQHAVAAWRQQRQAEDTNGRG